MFEKTAYHVSLSERTFLGDLVSLQKCSEVCDMSIDISTNTRLHSKKRTTCSGLMKTALNNVLLPTLFKVVNYTEQVDEPELACNQV